MNDTDRDNHQFNCEFAAESLVKHQTFRPLYVVYQQDRRQLPIADLWRLERDEASAVLRGICIAHDAAAVAVMTEAWAVRAAPKDAQAMLDAGITPSKSDRRFEVLTVAMATREAALGTMREILRDATGAITGLAEPMLGKGELFMNGLLHALGESRPPKWQQKQAQTALKRHGIVVQPIDNLRVH